jgi:hypothetical protein
VQFFPLTLESYRKLNPMPCKLKRHHDSLKVEDPVLREILLLVLIVLVQG